MHSVGALDGGANVIQHHHLISQADLVFEFAVDRHQIVSSLILQGVTGVVEERGVRAGGQARELCHRQVEIALACVHRQHDLEIEATKNGGDVLRIIFRIE